MYNDHYIITNRNLHLDIHLHSPVGRKKSGGHCPSKKIDDFLSSVINYLIRKFVGDALSEILNDKRSIRGINV